jgi:hypothetical protein
MPKVLGNYLGYDFYFWSSESSGEGHEPIHLHVSKGKPHASSSQFWIMADGTVRLAHDAGDVPPKDLQKVMEYIKANRAEVIARWVEYFRVTEDGSMKLI